MLLGSIELNVEAADDFTAALRRKQGSLVREFDTADDFTAALRRRQGRLRVTESCPAVW